MKTALRQRAAQLGFASIGFASARAPDHRLVQLSHWLADGHHGDMAWMADRPERRASPDALWADARSVILVGMSYAGDADPFSILNKPGKGAISLYAQRRDYHEIIKGKLKELAGFLVARAGGDVKVFVDTAPVMEKALAEDAGLGWQGKSTVLISRKGGAWLFLGAIYTNLDIPPDPRQETLCGSCTRCLDICPTAAFPAPYVLDSRRCIAYLTIEHKGQIPADLRAAIGNRVFGCDDCLAVCPWNKFAGTSRDARLATRNALAEPDLAMLAGLDDAAFRALFAGTPVKRTGRERFIRNVLIAIGNSGHPTLVDPAIALLDDPSPLVRGMAVWALGRLLPAAEVQSLAARGMPTEADLEVLAEWDAALIQSRQAASPSTRAPK